MIYIWYDIWCYIWYIYIYDIWYMMIYDAIIQQLQLLLSSYSALNRLNPWVSGGFCWATGACLCSQQPPMPPGQLSPRVDSSDFSSFEPLGLPTPGWKPGVNKGHSRHEQRRACSSILVHVHPFFHHIPVFRCLQMSSVEWMEQNGTYGTSLWKTKVEKPEASGKNKDTPHEVENFSGFESWHSKHL